MRQEVGTVACVVNGRRVFVSVDRTDIPRLEGKSLSKLATIKLADVEVPMVIKRCEVWPQLKCGTLVWSMMVEFESEEIDLMFLHGTEPKIEFECREEVSSEEEENYVQVGWLA